MLATLFKNQQSVLQNNHLKLGYVDPQKLTGRAQQALSDGKCNDEQVWTFLVACCFASSSGPSLLSHCLCGETGVDKIWLESLPVPPRVGEGNTHLDMALGAVQQRNRTASGIEYSGSGDWVTFCEMKWLSDIQGSVTHDPFRNQMTRVIENLLSFQNSDGLMPKRLHFTLVTPKCFRDGLQRSSRFYAYKFAEYKADPRLILEDMEMCTIEKRRGEWGYRANFAARLEALRLHWVTYEELIEQIPNQAYRKELEDILENTTGSWHQQ